MSLLYNVRCSIFRDLLTTDNYGGAVVTGTLTIATNEPCRLDYIIPKINVVAPQGLETNVTYSLYIRSTRQHPINIRENDYVQITFPTFHAEYNNRLRVRGVQRETLHPQDPNSILECELIRIRESRNNSID